MNKKKEKSENAKKRSRNEFLFKTPQSPITMG